MAAVPATLVGVQTSDDGSTKNVTIVGMLSVTGLGVGGGPIQPSGGVVSPPIYYPPSIWGPTDPRPSHPIAPGGLPPSIWPPPGVVSPPIYYPPGIWGPTDPRPTPPIYMPPSGGGGDGSQPPSDGWTWAWSPIYGWVALPPGGGGKPQPPGGEQPPTEPPSTEQPPVVEHH